MRVVSQRRQQPSRSPRPCRTRRPRPGTAALAALTATAALAGLVGCSGGGDGEDGGKSTTHAARPSPKPTPRWDRSPDSIAAVGDSITRAFDACGILRDCPGSSWATGTDPDVRSLAQRLLAAPEGHSWNHASTGARMEQLPGQMRRAAAHGPELVTVMIGANDACTRDVSLMTAVTDFRASFTAAMKELREKLPKTQVYVSSVPDLKRLWSEGRRNELGKQVWKLGLCQSILDRPDAMDAASAERRQQVYDRVVAYNRVLETVCDADKLCRYDDGAVFRYRFTGDQLSKWDWFHPSENGQERLAEMAYRGITAKS